jgi:hypothetical protein
MRVFGAGAALGDALVVPGPAQNNEKVIASIVTLVTIPAGLAQSEVRHRSVGSISQRDVGVIGTSLVSQDGRKEQYRARPSAIGLPER